VGRAPRADVLNLVSYVGDLLRRAAAASGQSVQRVAARVSAELPEQTEAALGA
jgi:hypothetical protein